MNKGILSLSTSLNTCNTNFINDMQRYISNIKIIAEDLIKVIPETEGNESYSKDYDDFFDINSLNRKNIRENLLYISEMEYYLKNYRFENTDKDLIKLRQYLINISLQHEEDLPLELTSLSLLTFDDKVNILITRNVVKIIYGVLNLCNSIDEYGIKFDLDLFENNPKINNLLESESYGFNGDLVLMGESFSEKYKFSEKNIVY